jgi:hypothetical protein
MLASELKLHVAERGRRRSARGEQLGAAGHEGDVHVFLEIGGVYAVPCVFHLVDDAATGTVSHGPAVRAASTSRT